MKLFTARFFLWMSLVFAFWLPATAFAATIYLDPEGGEYHPGDTFVVNIRLDANGDCVNVVSGDISYPKDYLRASAFSQGESILTLWTEAPRINSTEGRVSFVGGVPGGYCGRIAGDPGYANIIGKIIFSIPAETKPGILPPVSVLPSSQVLLADGRGTPAPLLTREATFTVASGTGTFINEWLEQIQGDTIPPEAFSIDLHHDENTVGGRYFVVFQTTDKQSGVAKYELIERDKDRPQFIRGTRTAPAWRPVESPYVLEDQTLNSTIIVRAIDNAGQVREESFLPNSENPKTSSERGIFPIIGGVIVFLASLAVAIRMRKPKAHSS